MKNIFVNCSISNIKIKNSDLYIARLHISYHVDGVYESKVIHIESDSPQENSLNALDLFKIKRDTTLLGSSHIFLEENAT